MEYYQLVDIYKPRELADIIRANLTERPGVLLHGARQTGKTTLAKHIARMAHSDQYLTLTDDSVLAAIRTDPPAFFKRARGLVVLDDVQLAPDLFPAIQAEVDSHPIPGRFLLIGAGNILPNPWSSESPAERKIEILTLHPLSQGEIEAVHESFIDALFAGTLSPADGCNDLIARILRGGYPSALERPDPESRRAWLDPYLAILDRDIRRLSHIDAPASLPRLLAVIAARTAGLLNFMDLARGSGIPQTTLKRYFALLETMFLARLVPAWASDSGQRLIKAPKLYLNDTGLASRLLDLDEERLERDASLKAALLENFVAMELEKQAGWIGAGLTLSHFRTAAGQKVDFVLEDEAGDIVGVEVKAGGAVSDRDFNGLRALADLAGPHFRNGIVLHTGSARDSFGLRLRELRAAPVSALWQSHAGGA